MMMEIIIYQYEKHIFTDSYLVPHVNTKPGI